jgi:hypothetical protein
MSTPSCSSKTADGDRHAFFAVSRLVIQLAAVVVGSA